LVAAVKVMGFKSLSIASYAGSPKRKP